MKKSFGSVLREPVITIRIGRMEFLTRTHGSIQVLMNISLSAEGSSAVLLICTEGGIGG